MILSLGEAAGRAIRRPYPILASGPLGQRQWQYGALGYDTRGGHGDGSDFMVSVRKARPLTWSVSQNGCHNCTSHAVNFGGYPCMMIRYKRVRIARHVYEQSHGKIPVGLLIRHTCDNPLCINPDHLIVGTEQDNSNDCVARGRTAKGEANGRSKLSEQDVIEILKSNESISSLARKYGVGRTAIKMILLRKNWRHVTAT